MWYHVHVKVEEEKSARNSFKICYYYNGKIP